MVAIPMCIQTTLKQTYKQTPDCNDTTAHF